MAPVSMTLTDQISRSRYYSTSNNSKMVQNRAILTVVDQQEVVYACHYLTLNISEMVRDT